MKRTKDYTLHLLVICFLLALLGSQISCTPNYGNDCKGNKDMLTAGAGKTKFKFKTY